MCLAVALLVSPAEGTVVDWVGISSQITWPTAGQWTALGNSTAEGDNGSLNLDFVGNSTDAGLYYAQSSSYVFFRLRLDLATLDGTTTPPNASITLLIDAPGGNSGIDWGFAWDTANYNNTAVHGLEMQKFVSGTTWGTTKMDDTDGTPSAKAAKDINGGGRSGDGYVRSDDGGTTTLVDFAVSWNYLKTSSLTGLLDGQLWGIAAATIVTGNDHSTFDGDIMGAALDSTNAAGSSGWSTVQFSPIPEPTSSLVGILIAAGVLRRRRE